MSDLNKPETWLAKIPPALDAKLQKRLDYAVYCAMLAAERAGIKDEAILAKMREDAVLAEQRNWAQDRAAVAEAEACRREGVTDEEVVAARKNAARAKVAA